MGNKEDSYRLGPKYLCVGQEALEAVCHVWMSGRPNTILMIFIMELMILGVMSRQLCLIKLILRCLPWFLLLQISMLSKIYVGCLNFIRTIQPGHYAFCRRSVKIWSSLQCHTRLELNKHLYVHIFFDQILQLSLLTIFHNILCEQKSCPWKDYENIVCFLTNLVRK